MGRSPLWTAMVELIKENQDKGQGDGLFRNSSCSRDVDSTNAKHESPRLGGKVLQKKKGGTVS